MALKIFQKKTWGSLSSLLAPSVALLWTSILSSCGSLLPEPTLKEVFILGADQEVFCQSKSDKGVVSDIKVQASPDFFRSQKIFFRKDAQLGNYQFSEWSEPLSDRIKRLLSERLRCQGFKIASSNHNLEQQGVAININILDFSQDISEQPGKFKGVFRVTTIKGPKLEEFLFKFETAVESFDSSGARLAADQTVAELFKKIDQVIAAN